VTPNLPAISSMPLPDSATRHSQYTELGGKAFQVLKPSMMPPRWFAI
jgi:hypothetical protein